MAWEPIADLSGPPGPPGEGGLSIVEDPSNLGLYLVPASLTEDPANSGLYLIGD